MTQAWTTLQQHAASTHTRGRAEFCFYKIPSGLPRVSRSASSVSPYNDARNITHKISKAKDDLRNPKVGHESEPCAAAFPLRTWARRFLSLRGKSDTKTSRARLLFGCPEGRGRTRCATRRANRLSCTVAFGRGAAMGSETTVTRAPPRAVGLGATAGNGDTRSGR